jgi:hypothetical protein
MSHRRVYRPQQRLRAIPRTLDKGRWERFFDLRAHKFAKGVRIEIRSSTFVPKGLMDAGTNTDTRNLGVQVKGILLRRDK